jgi:Fe-S-cluster-containing hydrogenase component 2
MTGKIKDSGKWNAPTVTEVSPMEGVKLTGTPSVQEIADSGGYPSEERYRKGPVAFIECVERIPCNPCEPACPYGAIIVGDDITNLPRLDGDKCIGCGLCVPICPGLAIVVRDFSYADDRATISFPYEYLPYPAVGGSVILCDRNGDAVCEGEVLKVSVTKRNVQTAVIKVAFERKHFGSVISMQRITA